VSDEEKQDPGFQKYTFYWNPSIKPDKEGKAGVEFWTSDFVTDYEGKYSGHYSGW